jgi:hypothetical protein
MDGSVVGPVGDMVCLAALGSIGLVSGMYSYDRFTQGAQLTLPAGGPIDLVIKRQTSIRYSCDQ